MNSQLIISVAECDTRVALVEDGRLAEFYLERHLHQPPTGNIYQGRVLKVLPGMAAAFLDLGLERPAYLYVEEVSDPGDDLVNLWLKEEAGELDEPDMGRPSPAPIEELLQPGQELLVQVFRPPLGNKGARLTTQITLPGHYLVYLPGVDHLGVSRRIMDEGERIRLRSLLEDLKPATGGLIARTASESQGAERLARERDYLVALWGKIRHLKETSPCPALLHQELEVTRRVVRDLYSFDMGIILVDDPGAYEQIRDYLGSLDPYLAYQVELYTGPEPLFVHCGLEIDWSRLLAPRVWLKSGGYILIEATEALTAIDVNTGRYIGRQNLKETILKTNLEAAQEIARQLRLRNIGGLIVIDFIDMEDPEHRQRVYQTLQEALKRDRAKSMVLPMSAMGLMEMTRQRLGDSLAQLALNPCNYCEGEGQVLSPAVLTGDIFRQLLAEAREFAGCRLTILAHPEVAAQLQAEGEKLWARLTREHQVEVLIFEQPQFSRHYYEITREWRKTG
ncbi:MAG: Rne/Rng family ribonuclease [Thermodesulfobacteriota bacterium]